MLLTWNLKGQVNFSPITRTLPKLLSSLQIQKLGSKSERGHVPRDGLIRLVGLLQICYGRESCTANAPFLVHSSVMGKGSCFISATSDTLRITGFIDFVIVRNFIRNKKIQRFGNWMCFHLQVRGERRLLLGPSEISSF
jgi:hypothetical protein